MRREALVLVVLLAGCGKTEPPAPAPAPLPAPLVAPPPPPPPARLPPPAGKSKMPEELRRKLMEQLGQLGDDPASAALKRKLQEKLGIVPEPPRELVPRPPAPPRPQVYLTVNGTDVPEIPAGFPILIEVTVHAPSSGPMKLESPSGNWGDLLRVEFPDGWTPKAVSQGLGALAMDGVAFGRLAWAMSPEEADARPRGDVEIRATLKCDRGEWRAVARVKLTAPKRLTPDQELERAFVLTQYHTTLGNAAGALADVEEALKKQPEQPALLELRAEALLALGRKADAIEALNAAIAAAARRRWPVGRLVVRLESLRDK